MHHYLIYNKLFVIFMELDVDYYGVFFSFYDMHSIDKQIVY